MGSTLLEAEVAACVIVHGYLSCSQCIRHHRRDLLVHPAPAPNLHQLPSPSRNRPATVDDASVGLSRRAIRRVQHRLERQRRAPDPSADPHRPEFGDVGAVPLLWQAVEHWEMC